MDDDSGHSQPGCFTRFWERIRSCFAFLAKKARPQRATMTHESTWTVKTDGQGSRLTDHTEEISRDGRRQVRSEVTRSRAATNHADALRHQPRSLSAAASGGSGSADAGNPEMKTVARMHGQTTCTTRKAASAEAIMRDKVESEKRQMEIIQEMLNTVDENPKRAIE